MSKITVAALYHFVVLDDYQTMQQPLLDKMLELGVKGTLLLASEGINGTIAGSQAAVDSILDWLKADSRLAALRYKVSFDDEMPFYRTRVKLKKEIARECDKKVPISCRSKIRLILVSENSHIYKKNYKKRNFDGIGWAH
mgnify:CR=1 FL=1